MAQHHTRTLGEVISGWWRNWNESHPREIGINSAERRTLAGKWPDSADPLSRRLAEFQLTENTVTQAEPGRRDHPDSK